MQKQEQDPSPQQPTYYFTYFECLEPPTLQLLFSYHSFIEKLIIHLGEDWRIESNLLWDEYHPEQDPEGCSNIFNVFLEVFLAGRLNNEFTEDTRTENVMLEEFHEQVVKEFVRILPEEKVKKEQVGEIGETLTFKTLSVGFFVTALELWDAALKVHQDSQHQPAEPGKTELKPLIISLETTFVEPTIKKVRRRSGSNFTESMRLGLQRLDLQSYESQSDCIQSSDFQCHKRKREKTITWRKFGSEQQLPEFLLKRIQRALVSSVKCEKWQLISTFVVNMLQVTYEKEGQRHNVRIIRVCKEFYQAVVLIWLLFNAKKNYSMKFREYEGYVKYVLADKWKEGYTLALKVAYGIFGKQWSQIVKEHAIDLNEDCEVMKIFFERIRNSLLQNWHVKIITINPEVFT